MIGRSPGDSDTRVGAAVTALSSWGWAILVGSGSANRSLMATVSAIPGVGTGCAGVGVGNRSRYGVTVGIRTGTLTATGVDNGEVGCSRWRALAATAALARAIEPAMRLNGGSTAGRDGIKMRGAKLDSGVGVAVMTPMAGCGGVAEIRCIPAANSATNNSRLMVTNAQPRPPRRGREQFAMRRIVTRWGERGRMLHMRNASTSARNFMPGLR